MHCIELSTSKVPRLELEYELCWSRDRVAEGAPLLREYVGKTCIEGSNPSGSAKNILPAAVLGRRAGPAQQALVHEPRKGGASPSR